MIATTYKPIEISLAEAYWTILCNLSRNVRKILATKLEASLQSNTAPDWTSEFVGAWQDNISADEMIADIRNHRSANRDVTL